MLGCAFPDRQAQIRHDFKRDLVAVHDAWPSAGDLRSYPSASDSVFFARDGFERLLNALARTDLTRVVVVGHSMGAKIVMETLHQMPIRGSPALFRKLRAVVLISPDLDVDPFRTQLAGSGHLDIPVSKFDRAAASRGL